MKPEEARQLKVDMGFVIDEMKQRGLDRVDGINALGDRSKVHCRYLIGQVLHNLKQML